MKNILLKNREAVPLRLKCLFFIDIPNLFLFYGESFQLKTAF